MKREPSRRRPVAAANDNPETDAVKPRKRGGRVHGAKSAPRPDRRARGAAAARDAGGGLPDVPNVNTQFVPQVQTVRGGGPPSPPSLPQQQQSGSSATDAVNALKAGEELGKLIKAKPGDSSGGSGNARGGAVRRGRR